MPSSTPRTSVLPADWPQTLDQIQEVLARALAEAEGRERQLAASPATSPTPDLQRLDSCLNGFRARLAQAERQVLEADRWLSERQEAVQQWSEAAASVRRRLAEARGASVE